MVEQYRKAALAARPSGYYVVNQGEFRPDDLIWDWVGKAWYRADDPVWGTVKVAIEDCVCVIRLATSGAGRTYTVRRGNDEPPLTPSKPAEEQQGLF